MRAHALLCEERRREILKLIEKTGRATVDDLAKKFHVSQVTIRADLDALSSIGALVRSRGGAVRALSPKQDVPLRFKKTLHHAEKVRIGHAAAQLIRPYQTVILDSGTTTAEVAMELKQAPLEGLTVITHALNIAVELADAPRISLILIGGVLRHVSCSCVGPQAERMLGDIHADHFFLAVDGLDLEGGLSTPDILEAQLNTLMMCRAKEVTVVADASKFGRRSLSTIGDLSRVHRVITDDRVAQDTADGLRKLGIEVVIV